jgi:DNA-binding transcriptional MocR family regulator
VHSFWAIYVYSAIPVPTDENGMKVDVLEKLMGEHFGGKEFVGTAHRPFRCMIYTVPTFHNPRGSCLAPGKPNSSSELGHNHLFAVERCEKMVQLARKYDALVFCDDVYNMLHYGGQKAAPPRLLTYDRP